MSAGLFGLLDDVAVLARLAAAAGRANHQGRGGGHRSSPSSAMSLRHQVLAERELPIIKRIAIGSLRNKLLLILPAAMLLSQSASHVIYSC